MNNIIDNEFSFNLSDKFLKIDDIEKRNLEVVTKINSSKINRNSSDMKKFKEEIKEKCSGKRIWLLFGSNQEDDKWLPLQIGSVSADNKDVVNEIYADFDRMIPFNKKLDQIEWTSKFYGVVMDLTIGQDHISQKYRKLKKWFSCFLIATADCDAEENNESITKYQIKEIQLAYDLKPLIWNPSPKEKKYIKEHDI